MNKKQRIRYEAARIKRQHVRGDRTTEMHDHVRKVYMLSTDQVTARTLFVGGADYWK